MKGISFGSFVKAGTTGALIAGFVFLLALTPFFNNILLAILFGSAVIIPFGVGMYYSYLAPGEEVMSQSVIGGALSGLVGGLILGIAFGLNAFMIGAVSTGLLGYAVTGSLATALITATVLGLLGALMGAVGGVLWQLTHRGSSG